MSVSDDAVEKAIQAIITAARTGRIGDGKIFFSKIDEAIRIRDDKRGGVCAVREQPDGQHEQQRNTGGRRQSGPHLQRRHVARGSERGLRRIRRGFQQSGDGLKAAAARAALVDST